MTITKYPQSAFVIESNGKRILIDPGTFCMERYKPTDLGQIDGILISHQHFDHLDKKAIKFWGEHHIPIYGNFDVVKVLAGLDVQAQKVEDRQKFELEGFEIEPVDLPHCKMADGSDGPPNTGYLINNIFFHPGDGIEISGLKVNNAGIPITGPTINFDNAWELVRSLEAKRVIPIHYSNPERPADPVKFKVRNKLGIEVVILTDGQSLELT